MPVSSISSRIRIPAMNGRTLLLPLLVGLACLSCRNLPSGRKTDVKSDVELDAKHERKTFCPGDTVSDAYVNDHEIDRFFSVQPVPDSIFTIMQDKTYPKDCTVPREDLCYLLCLHKDAAGRSMVGEMVLAGRIGDKVLGIFRQLYDAGYPIERMRLGDHWDGDDDRMMLANNTSCFNFRKISGTRLVSKHGLGLAVDINPLYNPYYKALDDGKAVVKPLSGAKYLDRDADFPYKIVRGDLCYRLFTENGFKWGGGWAGRKDYQHFEYSL